MRVAKFKGSLTEETLIDEYIKWNTVNGDGCDSENQRFGQHISNKYLRLGYVCPKAFYEESAKQAFEVLQDEVFYG